MKRASLLMLLIIATLVVALGYRYWPPDGQTGWLPHWSLGDDADPAAYWAADTGPEERGPATEYLRGVHWFGEGWPVNFWNTRLLDHAAEDFAIMREDGFNTVVLVIPWPGFATSQTNGAIDPDRAQRLEAVLDLAEAADLNVVLRLGYGWDASVAEPGHWLMQLWLREDVRQGWLAHIEGIWGIVSDRPNVRFGMISWADLWAVESLGESDLSERLELAVQTGFQQWLSDYVSLEQVSGRFGKRFDSFDEVPIPSRTEPAFGLFFDFIDDAWIERFFRPAQAVFPNLTMELRIDADPVWNAPGVLAYWHSHELAWDLPGATWAAIPWSPAMGGENRGELLSPKIAAERLHYQLDRVRAVTGDRPVFISQFLVQHEAPELDMNGRLPPETVGAFAERAQPLLESLTGGYSLWTWRDYAHDAVVSPDFSGDFGDWRGQKPQPEDAVTYAFRAGEQLRGNFDIGAFHIEDAPEWVELCLTAVTDGVAEPDVRLIDSRQRQRIDLDVSSTGSACVEIDTGRRIPVTLEALRDIDLLTITLAGFLQSAGIHTREGERKPIAATWSALNQQLQTTLPASLPLFADGWMGKSHSRFFRTSNDPESAVEFETGLPENWPFPPEITVVVNGRELARVACTAGQRHALPVPVDVLNDELQKVVLTADRVHRPDGDARRLGCMIRELSLGTGRWWDF